MRRALPLSLAAILLCGFGAGPFWGENKPPAASQGGVAEVSSTTYGQAGSHTTPTAISFDSTGADMLVAISCGSRLLASNVTSGTTAATWNGVAMTNWQVITSSVAGDDWPDCVVFYLTNPDQGTNNYSVTFDADAQASAHVLIALSGAAASQSGATDTDRPGAQVGTNSIDLAATAVGDFMFHLRSTRGGSTGPTDKDCTYVGFNEGWAAQSGTDDFVDIHVCVGKFTATDTNSKNSTLNWDNTARSTGGGGVVEG